MCISRRLSILVATTCLFAMMEIVPTMAQYQGPRGNYGSEADFTRDVDGTPCGIQCTQRAQKRWARYYARHARQPTH
jgi:hypothetical protein